MTAVPLSMLLQGIATVESDLSVVDVTLDSRRVARGGLFLACQGRRQHGLAGFAEAVARGAAAILWESAAGVRAPVLSAATAVSASSAPRVIEVPRLSRHVGTIAARFFGEPSSALTVAGITGTNGKTTSAWLLAQALTAAGRDCGYIGTLGVGRPAATRSGASLEEGAHTTADAATVQRQLAGLRATGARCVAMEVSSHALDQHRVDGVRFTVAAFSNLTRDHLDYHGSMAAYGAAKARLFEWPALRTRVINVDDDFGAALAARPAPSALCAVARSAAGQARIEALRARLDAGFVVARQPVRATPRGLALALDCAAGPLDLELPLIGEFNADNAMLVLGMLLALGVSAADAAASLQRIAPPPGRMESVAAAGRALAIVDYAHTPDALAKALQAARAHCRGRLSVVFGCGGDRDPGKRPLMGRTAAELADVLVITDDNPRGEAPQAIVASVLAGMPAGHGARVEHDRRAAIRLALDSAGPDDVVLIAGKGHEAYQIYGMERLPFSDREVAREVLAA